MTTTEDGRVIPAQTEHANLRVGGIERALSLAWVWLGRPDIDFEKIKEHILPYIMNVKGKV
jgi:hypothetical protein